MWPHSEILKWTKCFGKMEVGRRECVELPGIFTGKSLDGTSQQWLTLDNDGGTVQIYLSLIIAFPWFDVNSILIQPRHILIRSVSSQVNSIAEDSKGPIFHFTIPVQLQFWIKVWVLKAAEQAVIEMWAHRQCKKKKRAKEVNVFALQLIHITASCKTLVRLANNSYVALQWVKKFFPILWHYHFLLLLSVPDESKEMEENLIKPCATQPQLHESEQARSKETKHNLRLSWVWQGDVIMLQVQTDLWIRKPGMGSLWSELAGWHWPSLLPDPKRWDWTVQ